MFNKGAMFGLESRALRKQFGKLFLARMQSVASKETRGARIQSNRGAMFGLDARIALAIFGALSVISGAALYSAIQDSKVVSIITQAKEVAKAEEQYYLDTGVKLPNEGSGANASVLSLENLVTNTENVTGWNGPYISMTMVREDRGDLGEYDAFIRVGSESTWGDSSDIPSFTGTACPNKPCYSWIQFNVTSSALADAIDEKIDGALDRENGDVRVRSSDNNIFIKSRLWLQ